MADNIIAPEVRDASILPFRGLELPVFRHRLGQYVAIRPLCEMLGIGTRGQQQRILGHPVLAKGARIFSVPEFMGTYLETRAIEEGIEASMMRVARAEELNDQNFERCVTHLSKFEGLNAEGQNQGDRAREDGADWYDGHAGSVEELNADGFETSVTEVSKFEELNPKRENRGGARRIFCLEQDSLVQWLLGFHPNRYKDDVRERLMYAQERINLALSAHRRVFEQGRQAHLNVARFMELSGWDTGREWLEWTEEGARTWDKMSEDDRQARLKASGYPRRAENEAMAIRIQVEGPPIAAGPTKQRITGPSGGPRERLARRRGYIR